jgi:RNase P/RNase MRP subunit p29
VTPLAVVPITPGTRIRVVTSSDEHRKEGKLVSVDNEGLVVDAGEAPVRIPRSELISLEVREKGSSGMRVLGGLGGAVAGLAVTGLICASTDDLCDSIAVAWVGTGVGAAMGVVLVGGGSWKPVTLATAGPVALDLRVRPAAAGLNLRVGF